MGRPPALIEELADHVARELADPELGRRYGLHRARTWLLSGLPGTGKTMSILALWRRVYEVVAAHTGAAVEELPARVLRLRLSDIVSHWFGDTDRNLARFFTEVEELAATPWTGPDGRVHELPVVVICEEIDGLARRRGESEIHDRVLTTALERLDMNHPGLRDKIILFLFTTNVPGLVDAAFLRRAGGRETVFGALDENGFRAVLEKQLARLPVATRNGESQEVARAATVDAVSAWLFSPNGDDPGQVELHWMGAAAPERRHRRDLLTGGLVERSVQAAASAACEAERRDASRPGVGARELMLALHDQVRSLVARLEPGNVAQHLALPEGRRVGRVRVLPDAPLTAVELLRDSERLALPTGDAP
jgi:SpoVK/Ycf46/Vps4 family AAA+-type ATPase